MVDILYKPNLSNKQVNNKLKTCIKVNYILCQKLSGINFLGIVFWMYFISVWPFILANIFYSYE